MKNIIKRIFFVISILLLGCNLPTETGQMPKDISDTKFEDGLNILGILRLDYRGSNSFVYIEKALPTKEYKKSNEFKVIKNADVKVWNSSDTTKHTFTINSEEDTNRYTNNSFTPSANETYNLKIKSITEQGSLSVSAKTKVPAKSKISRDSIKIKDNTLEIDLDNSYERYEFVLYSETNFAIANKTLYKDKETVKLNFPDNETKPFKLDIFSYDENLAKYLKASNGLLPQTYRKTLSTVEGGYGCFGAISLKSIIIN